MQATRSSRLSVMDGPSYGGNIALRRQRRPLRLTSVILGVGLLGLALFTLMAADKLGIKHELSLASKDDGDAATPLSTPPPASDLTKTRPTSEGSDRAEQAAGEERADSAAVEGREGTAAADRLQAGPGDEEVTLLGAGEDAESIDETLKALDAVEVDASSGKGAGEEGSEAQPAAEETGREGDGLDEFLGDQGKGVPKRGGAGETPGTGSAAKKFSAPSPPDPWMVLPPADADIPGLVSESADKYHVVLTAGSGVYAEWQSRVMYYWYQRMRSQYPESALGGFTRVVHTGKADYLMEEIPTVVVDLLPDNYTALVGNYPVLNRPYGLLQWVRSYKDQIPEQYILMAEPDHIFMLPPPLWATPDKPAAFPFFYITPEKYPALIAKFNPRSVPVDKFAPIGSSPVIMHKDQFAAVCPRWLEAALQIKADAEADKEFGWVQEMYAFSVALATALDRPIEVDVRPEFMVQPPWDSGFKVPSKAFYKADKYAYVLHFTYGSDFDLKGKFTPGKVGPWHWDKRDWMHKYPPLNFPQLPRESKNDLVRRLVGAVNEVAAALPDWAQRAQ
ncbi:hypothetical protein H632_c496p0 [Helicosporidium sp. ATCC 50920]|nr:hypothetical protein H632_c496p0 [Helicosporidium sp. ATCC 50920]|eukprot:KDD75792.1 hypothetical protein H632_c496p0 [Helicosporidium sp. ATCC 50920]